MGTAATGPGYTTCKGCGAKLYPTSSGQFGVFMGHGQVKPIIGSVDLSAE
jgi:hypothetical protein